MTFSALTSDIERDPAILHSMELEAWAASPRHDVAVTVHGPVTTVRAL